jgi:hypothetical protein
LIGLALLFPGSASAVTPFVFSTGNTDGLMAMASRPNSVEIEAADDFVLEDPTNIANASFTGLLPSAAPTSTIQQVVVEIYRVFPLDSDSGRTINVPTRTNSPSDVEFADADAASGTLSFTAAVIASSFTAGNSVLNGIHPTPTSMTGGDGSVSGEEVSFNLTFDPPLSLPAGHYFFVPQVQLSSGNFFWLSAPKPIVPPGTPFPIGETDLQTWIRNANLEPDWLRVRTDIVGGSPQFNAVFSLAGVSGCPAISVTPASAPDATAGDPYSAAFGGSGGAGPYKLSASGQLPPGMSFSSATLSGTPTQAGTFTFSLTATDAQDCTGTTNVTLKVVPAGAGGAKPVITSARLSHRTFRAAGHGPSLSRKHKPPIGTKVTYKDSEAATTTFTVSRALKGHKRGRRCVAGKPRKHQKRCTRYVRVGAIPHSDKAGSVSVRFSGRVNGKKLKPGHYRLTLTPKLGGLSGKSVKLSFRIVR